MRFTLPLVYFLLPVLLAGQSTLTITGVVVEASNGNAMPFVAITLKKNLSGTVSNEGGRFEFTLPAALTDDTLQFTAFGFKRSLVPLKMADAPLAIRLQQTTLPLKESDVRLLPAESYVRLAVQGLKNNYPQQPFIALAYYREKLTENKNFRQLNEGLFKTYYPSTADSLQNQLMLYRQAEEAQEFQFIKEEPEKVKAQEKKSGKKSQKGLKRDLAQAFSGPCSLLSVSKLNGDLPSYVDTAKWNAYHYKFAKSSTYDQQEVLVIEFNSKNNYLRESGKLYIDRASLAIIRIESSGDYSVPKNLRPLILSPGFRLENPSYSQSLSFQKVGTFCYPQQSLKQVHLPLTRHHLFSKNEQVTLDLEQACIVNQLRLEDIKAIPPALRFSDEQEPLKAVHNDENLNWDKVNKLKK